MSYPRYQKAATLFPTEKNWNSLTSVQVTVGSGVTINNGILTLSAGTNSYSNGLIVFSNSNNVTFGAAGSIVTASASFSQTALFFSNSNGITFGTNGSTVTASVATQAAGTISAGGNSVALGQVVFSNSNGFSFGLNGSTITASYTTPPLVNSSWTASAGTQSATISQLVFSNSHGVSFGLSNGIITASASQSSLVFSNSNGVSFGTAGSTVTATVKTDYQSSNLNYLTSQSNQAVSAANGSFTFQTLSLADSNGVSFSTGTQGLYATVKTDYQSSNANYLTSQSNQALSGSNGSFAFQTATFGNLNGLSFYSSNGSMVGSYTVPAQSVQPGIQSISGGTTRITTGEVVFSNSNGLSFGVNGNTITGSYTVPTETPFGLSAGTQSVSTGTLVFSNSNGISFGMSGSSRITASYTVPTLTNSSLSISAGNGSSLGSLSQLVFSNANSISFGLSTSNNGSATLTGSFSYTVPTLTNSSLTMAAGGSTLSSVSQVIFSNSNGISFGASTSNNGSITITASHNGLTSQSNQAFSAQGGSSAFQTLVFTNSNGFSFSNTGGSIWGSYTVPTQTNQTIGLYASSQTVGQSSSSTIDARSLTVRGMGIVSAGMSGGELIISASAAGAADGYNIIAAGTQTANTTGSVVFSNANGVSFGMNNSSIVTATVVTSYQPAGAYLTTARASNDAVGLNTALTANGVAWTVNSSGISLNVPAFLTTADLSANSSKYVQNWKLTGNTAGTTSSAQGTDLWFGGGNGVTVSGSANTISFSVATNYQSQGAYLTTARASNDAVGLNTALTANGVAWTVNSSGISLNVPAFLTTAAQSTQTLAFSVGGNSATTNSSNITAGGYVLAGGNGVTVQQSNNTVSLSVATNYQSQGAYLTTAAQSTQTLAFSLSGNTATTNSSQITAGGYALAGGNGVTLQQSNNTVSVSVATNYQSQGAYLTTAMASNRGTDFVQAAAVFNGTNASGTIASGAISVSVATQSVVPQNASLFALGNTTQNSSTVLSVNALSFNAIGSLTVGYSNGSIQFSAPNALTSQSNQAVSAGNGSSAFQTLSFADSNGVSWSTAAGGIIATVATTYAASNHSHGNPTLALTNLTGTTASASNGFTLSLSAAAAGGGGSINLSAGTTSNNLTAFVFSNTVGGVSFGLNGSTITAEAALNFSAGTTSNNISDQIIFSNSPNISFGLNGSTITGSVPATSSLSGTGNVSVSVNGSTIFVGAPVDATLQRFDYPSDQFTNLGTIGQGSLSINRVFIPFNVTASIGLIAASVVTASAAGSTGTQNISLWMGVYTLNGSNLSLATSGSANNSFQVSSGTPANSTNYMGMRQLTVPMTINITPGAYWIGAVISTGTVGTACNLSLNIQGASLIQSSGNPALAAFGINTAAGRGPVQMQGIYTANTAAGPTVISTNGINMTSASNAMRANFYFQLANATY